MVSADPGRVSADGAFRDDLYGSTFRAFLDVRRTMRLAARLQASQAIQGLAGTCLLLRSMLFAIGSETIEGSVEEVRRFSRADVEVLRR
jgi:hypothetical protein